MDGSGPKFFSLIDSVLSIVLAASLLAAGPRALAETGAIMIATGQMKLGSAPSGFTFARTGRGGEAEWTVTEDQTASMSRAIEQTSTDRTVLTNPERDI